MCVRCSTIEKDILRVFVVKSSKFLQILAENFTFVMLATSFFKALNTKLFKYFLL
jgi:hypothetical protein